MAKKVRKMSIDSFGTFIMDGLPLNTGFGMMGYMGKNSTNLKN